MSCREYNGKLETVLYRIPKREKMRVGVNTPKTGSVYYCNLRGEKYLSAEKIK